jgi:hypothetical protein
MPAHLTRPARHDRMVELVERMLKLHVKNRPPSSENPCGVFAAE